MLTFGALGVAPRADRPLLVNVVENRDDVRAARPPISARSVLAPRTTTHGPRVRHRTVARLVLQPDGVCLATVPAGDLVRIDADLADLVRSAFLLDYLVIRDSVGHCCSPFLVRFYYSIGFQLVKTFLP